MASVIIGRSMSQSNLAPFEVTGGPLASPLHMGWHVTDRGGRTLAVANDDGPVKLLEVMGRISVASLMRVRCELYTIDGAHVSRDDFIKATDWLEGMQKHARQERHR